ncbi:hypothetical protein ABPG73_018222 [Tetrahymena malaccensis]
MEQNLKNSVQQIQHATAAPQFQEGNQNVQQFNQAAQLTDQQQQEIERQAEEKMIRRPLMRSDSQTDSDKSSGHERSSSSSNNSQENIGQQANTQLKQKDSTHSHHSNDQTHSHNHQHHNHSQHCSHSHGHQRQLSNSQNSRNQVLQNQYQNQTQSYPQNSMQQNRQQQQKLDAILNTESNNDIALNNRQSSLNEEEKQILEDIYNDAADKLQQKNEITSAEYAQMLKASFKNCFHTSNLDNLDSQFKELQQLISEIQICDMQVLDSAFFKKVVLLAQLENPKRCLKVIYLFFQLFNDKIILKHLLKLADYNRLIVDIINSYYILLEKFKNTKLEIELKISFNNLQNILDSQGHYEEFKLLIEQQTTLQSLDSIDLTSEQKEVFETIKHYSKLKEIYHKQEAIKYIVLLLGKCETAIQQYKILVHHLSPIFLELSNANYENNESKVIYVNQVLDLLDRYIFPIEFLINFDTSRIQGTKTYYLRNLKHVVQYFQKLYTLVGGFLNSVLLMPQEIQLNLRALFMIRRMYYFFYDDSQIRRLMEGPIIVILSNLALFTKDVVQKKEPTLFLHKLLDDQNTLQSLKEKLEQNEYIKTLKENKYFGVMAKCYPQDIDVQYNFKNLNFQVNYPVYRKIDAGSFYYYNILVTKQDTIIYWSFKTLNYDIKFGLFKMETLSNELQIDSYEEEKQIKAIVKLQKADSHKEPVMAYSLVSQPGYYRIVFDNTYSYWREKELLYTIQVLEP